MTDINRRDFLSAATLAAATAIPIARTASSPRGQPLALAEEKSIAELSAGMKSGELTARSITAHYLERITSLDRQGPTLRHLLEINPDAMAIADALDAERKSGRVRGRLHGIPVLVKDKIDTGDRMTTTAGSLALVGSIATRDAHVVGRLRVAGAIILGKTNLSEWANFRSSHSSSGWSARGGQGRNPYALDRTPSGSSSGSAGAVASNYCAAAVGTETDGSITSPAAACSLVGLKPTVGLVSRGGIIPIAHSQDTAGPMARTVTDAAILLTVLAGRDPQDAATQYQPASLPSDYTCFLDVNGLRGARIGVARKKYTGYSTQTDARFETALTAMRENGAVIIDPANITTAGRFDDAEYEVLLYEFKTGLNAYLATMMPGARARTIDDLIAFNRAHAREEMPFFRQEIFEQAAKRGPLSAPAYRKALAACRKLARTDGLDATFAKHTLDAIVAPTQGPPALIDLVNGDPSGGSSTSPCAVAGYPAITVPMGYVWGLPVGITFMGRAWSEPSLLRFAYALEQVITVRTPPRFLQTANLAAD